jgi:N-methylhydantoinase A
LTMLEDQAIQEFTSEHIDRSRMHFLRYGRCRYQNQEHFVEIALPEGAITSAQIETIVENFRTNYEREYTYRLDAPAELVCYHLVATAEVDKLKPEVHPRTGRKIEDAVKGKREVDFVENGIHQATIYNGDALEPGMNFAGPAIIEESGTTVVSRPLD